MDIYVCENLGTGTSVEALYMNIWVFGIYCFLVEDVQELDETLWVAYMVLRLQRYFSTLQNYVNILSSSKKEPRETVKIKLSPSKVIKYL